MSDRIQSDSPSSVPLLVVGSVAFDNVITPYGEKEHILGGAASYCSFAASYFTDVQMVGVIGNDFPREAALSRALRRWSNLGSLSPREP